MSIKVKGEAYHNSHCLFIRYFQMKAMGWNPTLFLKNRSKYPHHILALDWQGELASY